MMAMVVYIIIDGIEEDMINVNVSQIKLIFLFDINMGSFEELCLTDFIRPEFYILTILFYRLFLY